MKANSQTEAALDTTRFTHAAQAQWAAMQADKNIAAMDEKEQAFYRVENFDLDRP